LGEPDDHNRQISLNEIPSVFRERVIPVRLPLLSGGLLGRTVSEVKELDEYWEWDLKAAIARWLAMIRLHARPVFLLKLVSPGGSGVLGRLVAEHFKDEYDQADIYAVFV